MVKHKHKYEVGDKVRIVDERTIGMVYKGDMDRYLGTVMTINCIRGNSYYSMEEDGRYWSDEMIAGLEIEKVELHPDFKDWYEEIGEHWTKQHSKKSFAIYLVNQMGFGKGLENSYGEDISEVYPKLRDDMQENKEKYTRAILDENWFVIEEQMYYVKMIAITGDAKVFLNQDKITKKISFGNWFGYNNCKTEFTKKEIEEIDERYLAFKIPVYTWEGL